MQQMGVQISELRAEDIDRLEGLWLGLLAHHRALDADVPHRSPEESWPLRRAAYRHWLAEEGFGFVAELPGDDDLAGYAVVSVEGPDETWDLGRRTAELQTLVVRPDVRGGGAGTALVQAVDTRLGELSIADVLVGVVAANVSAVRFYERFGWKARYALHHRRVPTPLR